MAALGKRTLGLSYGLIATDLVLAPAIPSNTARAGGMVFPLVRASALRKNVLGGTRNYAGNTPQGCRDYRSSDVIDRIGVPAGCPRSCGRKWKRQSELMRLQQIAGISGPSEKRVNYFVPITAATAALAGLLFGFDTGVISGAILFIKGEFGLTPFTEELLVSAAVCGATLTGRLTDLRGRKRTSIIATAGVGLVNVLMTIISIPLLDRVGRRLLRSEPGRGCRTAWPASLTNPESAFI
jgi:sodium:sulfate symporter-like transmembrane protein